MTTLAEMLEPVPAGIVSVNWTRPDGTFTFTLCATADAAEAVAARADTDVWISCMSVDRDTERRGTADEIRRLNWLPIDLDVKPGSFPDLASAIAAVDTLSQMLGHLPVGIVFTGHGLQPWWLTDPDDDAWRCDGPHDPRWLDMLAAVRRWGRLVAHASKLHGAEGVDGVADLARVMRAPGTTNRKFPDEQVKVVAFDRGPWSPLTFAELLDVLNECNVPEQPEDRDKPGDVVLDPHDWPSPSVSCDWGKRVAADFANDRPRPRQSRHNWLLGKATRLAAMRRYGCLTEDDALAGARGIAAAFTAACADAALGSPPGKKPIGRGEVAAAFTHGVRLVASWTDQQVADELTPKRADEITGEPPRLHTHTSQDEHDDADIDEDDMPTHDDAKADGSARARIVRIATHRYRIGLTLDEQPFIVPTTGPNAALLSARAKRDLAFTASAAGRKPPGRTPLDEAWQTIEGLAYRKPKEALPMRVGQAADGAVVLDLGDIEGRAVVITADGWEVVDRSPITFRRPKTMLPLPTPARDGHVDPLWGIVNIDPAHRHLATAWLACTLLPGFPHSIVQIRGEQGAAKTTAAVTMGRLVDPCVAELVGPPRDDAHWMSMAGARWILPVDNVSHIQPWWSDSLARATTGAGDLKRALYTDSEVSAVAFKLCIILNGISLSSALRSDLAERLIPFDLRRPAEYLHAAELETRFTGMHAGVLGALLDIATGILASQRDGTAETPTDLRMADMAGALAHYDAHVGASGPTSALGAYRAQVADAFAEALDADPVARTLLTYMSGREFWEGTVGDLLNELNVQREARNVFGNRDDGEWWATNSSILARNLPRSAPVLARSGLTVRLLDRTKRGRMVRLEQAAGDGSGDGDDAR